MNRLILISVLLTFNLGLWSQDSRPDLNDYLLGDWYFFDKGDSLCYFDSSYNEIVFLDSFYIISGGCDYSMVQLDFLLDSNKLILPSDIDDNDIDLGTISIIDSNRFQLNQGDGQLLFKRIANAKYKLSDYFHDEKLINRSDFKMPKYLVQDMKIINSNYYGERMRLREYWIRLERKEIDKAQVIRWVDEMIENVEYSGEERELKVFRGMVDNIFD